MYSNEMYVPTIDAGTSSSAAITGEIDGIVSAAHAAAAWIAAVATRARVARLLKLFSLAFRRVRPRGIAASF